MKKASLCFLVCFLFAACGAPSNNAAIDKANFALDSCSPSNTSACDEAIAESQKVIDADSANSEARMINSSALASKAGFDILEVLVELTKTGTSGSVDNDREKFKTMRDAVVTTITDIDGLRSAIEIVPSTSAPTDSADRRYNDYYFQTGVLKAFEAFTLPTIKARPTNTSLVNISLITSAHKDSVQSDFLGAEPDLYESGIQNNNTTGWQIVETVRENYCVLKNAAVSVGTTSGFSLAILQDMVTCQLCSGVTDTSVCTKNADNMGAGEFQSAITGCATFNFTACANAGRPAL